MTRSQYQQAARELQSERASIVAHIENRPYTLLEGAYITPKPRTYFYSNLPASFRTAVALEIIAGTCTILFNL